MAWAGEEWEWSVLEGAYSLKVHRRIAKALEPVSCQIDKSNIEQIAISIRPRQEDLEDNWVDHLVMVLGGKVLDRLVNNNSPVDAPLLVSDRRNRFVIYNPIWENKTRHGRDWNLALALGHQCLHWPPPKNVAEFIESENYETDVEDADILYCPYLIANTSQMFPARMEAIWHASSMLMPSGIFERVYHDTKGDITEILKRFKISVSREVVEARAKSLGLL
jgi:hypothetical protein